MVGTNELVVAQREHEDELRDGPTEFDLRVLGRKAIRIEVPLTSVYTLRRVASLMHSHADRLAGLCRQQNTPMRAILVEAGSILAELQYEIREAHGHKRLNKNGSTKS